jgi:hypothetical protein
LEGQVHVFISQEQGGPVKPPGTGFPFVASYDSQGCGGGILTHLYTGRAVLVEAGLASLSISASDLLEQCRDFSARFILRLQNHEYNIM